MTVPNCERTYKQVGIESGYARARNDGGSAFLATTYSRVNSAASQSHAKSRELRSIESATSVKMKTPVKPQVAYDLEVE
jgi:hypothetical protein